MGLIGGIWLVLLGVLAASNLIIARKPEAKELIAKIAPYQGWIGVASAFWGAWGIINSVLSLAWIAFMPIYWATYLASSVLQFALGILLGVGTLKMFVKQPQAVEKMDNLTRDIESIERSGFEVTPAQPAHKGRLGRWTTEEANDG